MAELAASAHRNGKYPVLGREFYEFIKEMVITQQSLCPEDRTAQILQTGDDYDLTPEMDDTKFTLGKRTSEYFERFKHTSIRFLNLQNSNLSKDECAVNYLWFSEPAGGSQLGARGRGLGNDGRAFGVLRKSAEGTSQNSGYSATDVKNAVSTAIPRTLDALGLPALKGVIASSLEKNILEAIRSGKQ